MRALPRVLVVLLICLALPAGTAEANGEERTWSLQAGVLGGRHDNFFFRGEGESAPASDLMLLYADFEHERERGPGPGELTFLAGGSAVFVPDIDGADYQTAAVGAEYQLGATKLSLEVSRLLNRVFSESGERIFFDENAVELWVRYVLSPRIWVRGEVELERWEFDPGEDERDADVVELAGTVRVALAPRVGLRGSLLYETRSAEGDRHNREGEGFALALEARPTERVDLFLRFRRRDREYADAPPGDRNFGREDTTDDIDLNLRWRVGERWGVQVTDSYREADSTRPDRNYDGNQLAGGIFVRF